MAEIKAVINDPKTGKSYQKILSKELLLGKKIRQRISGNLFGLPEYELEITGGSDDAGFPMRTDIEGTERKRALLTGGPGIRIGAKIKKEKGLRLRKTVRGNTIGEKTAQVNMKIVKYGAKPIEELLGKKEGE